MKRGKAGVRRGTQDQAVPLRLKALTLSLRDRHQGEAMKAMKGRGWRTKTTEGKQLLMFFFKNNLTFTCFPRVQPGQSSAKGQQPSICAAGMPHGCRIRAIFIRAQKKKKKTAFTM